jgi:hydrogenase maturation factor
MCVIRVGKVLSTQGDRAKVQFFDGALFDDIDVSTLNEVSKGTFVEVFSNVALSKLRPSEARARREAWHEIMRTREESGEDRKRRVSILEE